MNTVKFYESHLEEAAVEWFQELGYDYVFGPDIAPDAILPERSSFNDVILNIRVFDSLSQINPTIPEEGIHEAIRQLLYHPSPSVLINNVRFQRFLTEGVNVPVRKSDGATQVLKVNLFDFDNPLNNQFIVVNQLSVTEHQYTKRPDLVVFVNGIPLVVFELKSASEENVDISDAFNQIRNYIKTIPSLFNYNSFAVISDGINAQAGTITSSEDRFMSWRTMEGSELAPQNIPQLEVLIKGLFRKEILLDIIKNFVLFQSDNSDYIKIIAGYHQYHAVNKAITSTIKAIDIQGDRRAGVIWHTQGSGKSLTMVFYVGKLVTNNHLDNPTIVVITDRNDLDDQLYETFNKSKDILRNTPVQANDRAHLRVLLNQRTSGGIIFTTIHKFSPEENNDTTSVLTDRRNVIVIADEAHRSQYGFEAQVVSNINKDEAEIKYGYAKYMRESLPNASYIGFTGTPIELTDKSTQAVFGNYIDVYDMTRAVEDGTTVRIYYESRLAKLELPEKLKPQIDVEYEEITEFQEQTQREQLKSKWARLEAIVGAKERVEIIAKDIINHFENREKSQEFDGGKGMIVAMSRRIAVDLYQAITALRPQWHSPDINKGQIKVVMTGSSSDPESWQEFVGSKASRETLAKRYKDKNDELKLVIVRDMWLTGFDVPSMHTMYIDKPMSGHNLMQAIARVNRVFKEKQGGLVVDYIGIAENLKNALAQYTDSDRKNTGVNAELASQLLLEKYEIIKSLLHKHNYQKFFAGSSGEKMQAISETMDFVLGLGKDDKESYLKIVNEMARAYSLCSTTDIAINLNVEVGFHKAVRAAIIKLQTDDGKKKTIGILDSEINQLISKSISSNEVVDILGSVGLNKPNIGILSEEFLEEVKSMKQKNLAVELLNRLLKGQIKSFSRRNLIQSRKFSEMLSNTLIKYQNRAIETAIIIQELIDLAKQISEAEDRGEKSGLSQDELAFYDALADNETAKEVLGDVTLKKIARELIVSIKNDMSVDWTIRESVQAKMRANIKTLLKKYGYPPDQSEKAVALVIEQSKLMASSIAGEY